MTAAFLAALRAFEGLGADIRPVDCGFMHESRQASRIIVSSDAAAFHADRLNHQSEGFSAVEYALARHAQARLRHRLTHVFDNVDILLTPATPMAAPRRDDSAAIERARASISWFTAPFNMAGVPAISVPGGFAANGMPLGLQIAAPHWHEARLLQAAYAYEQAADWHPRRPPLA